MTLISRRPGAMMLWGAVALAALLLATALGCSRDPDASTETPPLTESVPGPTVTSEPLAASRQGRTVTSASTLVPTPMNTPVPPLAHTPSPTITPTPLSTATPIPRPTGTPTPEPTNTPSPAPTATLVPTQEPTATPAPTVTLTPVPTATWTATPEPTSTTAPMSTPTPEPTATPSATPTPIPTPTATPTPAILPDTTGTRQFDDPDIPYLRWEVGPDVPDAMFYEMREGAALLHQYAEGLGLPAISWGATVYMYGDLDTKAQVLTRLEGWERVEDARSVLARREWAAVAGLEPDLSCWIFPDTEFIAELGEWVFVKIAAHELAHCYQYRLGGLDVYDTAYEEVRVYGPAWLMEGTAEFQAARVLSNGSVIPYDQRREHHARLSRQVEISLSEMETYAGLLSGHGHFDVAVMAAELLAQHAGEGSLITYWALLGPETPWQKAFQTAFGMTVEEFYSIFEEHRTVGFPELDLQATGPSIASPAPTPVLTAMPTSLPTGTPTATPVPHQDREALTAFYHATGGPNWEDDTNWLTDAPIGQWYGVRTDESGRVVSMQLPDNGLTGHLPPELGYLDELRTLALYWNELSGTIPSEMANLSRLEWLDLGDSMLTGQIPSWLGNLGKLTYLGLWGSQLTGPIPPELGALSDLQTLDLRDNRLTGPIPPQLSDLYELRVLLLSHNRMEGNVPAWLGELPNLRELELQGNRLTGAAPKLAPERTREMIETLSWVRDGVQPDERSDYDYLVRLADKYPLAVLKALDKDWLDDGISRTEFAVIEGLGLLSPDSLVRIIEMPFLERIGPADPNAAASLQRLENDSRDDFQRIMAHPTIADGIDDEEAKIVTLLYGTNRSRPELVEPLLSGTDVYLEERTIQLPLAGETLLAIIRVQDQPNRLMDYLEIGIRNMEMFVGEPMPTNYMAVYLPRRDPNTRTSGVWHGTHQALTFEYDDPYWQNPDSGEVWAGQFAHEIAHYYFGSWFGFGGRTARMRVWMAEGAAQFLGDSLSERVRVGRPIAPTLAPCHSATTIAELDAREIVYPSTSAERRADIAGTEENGPRNVDDRWLCNYTLGERLFIDLYRELGEETFLRAMGNLHRKTLRDDPADDCEGTYAEVCHLRHAFRTAVPPGDAARVKAIIDKWYYGE